MPVQFALVPDDAFQACSTLVNLAGSCGGGAWIVASAHSNRQPERPNRIRAVTPCGGLRETHRQSVTERARIRATQPCYRLVRAASNQPSAALVGQLHGSDITVIESPVKIQSPGKVTYSVHGLAPWAIGHRPVPPANVAWRPFADHHVSRLFVLVLLLVLVLENLFQGYSTLFNPARSQTLSCRHSSLPQGHRYPPLCLGGQSPGFKVSESLRKDKKG